MTGKYAQRAKERYVDEREVMKNKNKTHTLEDLQKSYREPAPAPALGDDTRNEYVRRTIQSAKQAWLFDKRVVVDLPPVRSNGWTGLPHEISEVDPDVLLQLVREAVQDGRLILETSDSLEYGYTTQRLLDKKK